MTNLEKFILQLGERAGVIGQQLAELILSDVEEFLINRGVDIVRCPALIRRIALIRANQIGSEGVINENYSGISQQFMASLPPDITGEINSLRSVRFE